MITPELSAAIEALIVRALPTADWSNKAAIEKPRSLRIYATEALFEYYLAPDGVAYELDLDRSPRYERVESADTLREVYAKAAERFPELAALAGSDPAEAPTTFEQALTYPAKVIAAWDDADPTGTTLVACTDNRPLASRTVTPLERDALLDQLDRDHPIGVVSVPLVWHVELITGFNVHDANGLKTSYVMPHDVARVRSSRSVELIDATGKVTTIIDHVEPATASRMARDFANWLGRFHEDNGVPRANEGELALVRACRELAQRNLEVPGYKVMRELRVSAGPFGGARDVAVFLGNGAVHLDVELPSGARRVRQLRKPADDHSNHFRTNQYLERPWIIRDIVRAVRELVRDAAAFDPAGIVAAWDKEDDTLRVCSVTPDGLIPRFEMKVDEAERDAVNERIRALRVRIGGCYAGTEYVWVADPVGLDVWSTHVQLVHTVHDKVHIGPVVVSRDELTGVEAFEDQTVPGDHGIQLVTRGGRRIVIDAYIPDELTPAWDPFVLGYEELRAGGFGMWAFIMRNDIKAWLSASA